MTTTKKITKRERFNSLLSLSEVQADAGLVAFIEHEIELLDKKNSADKKPTAKQSENEAIKDATHGALEKVTLYSILEDPMTSCGCFECICGIEPVSNGFIVVNRE